MVKERRLELKETVETKYTEREVAKAVGCSVTHYGRLENGSREFYQVKWLYGVAKVLDMPIDKLCKVYLGLSDEEVKKHFTITNGDFYSHDSGQLVKSRRKKEGDMTQGELAQISGCSKSHLAHMEADGRTIKDVRLLYGLAKTLDIPLWVFIRNELGLEDEELRQMISL